MYIPGKDDDEALDGIDPEDLEIDDEDVDPDDEPRKTNKTRTTTTRKARRKTMGLRISLLLLSVCRAWTKRILRTQWTIEAKILKGTPMTRRERRIPRMKTETLTTIEDLQLCLERLITLLSNEA